MLTFPFIESVKINNYALYPGPARNGRFDIQFTPGPWIILGVNGLGKSTLLLLLKHVLTGTKQSIKAGFRGEERSETTTVSPRLFASRVADEAETATATVTCRFGKSHLSITRKLSDLSFCEASLRQNDTKLIPDETTYFQTLASQMGVVRFEDALRVIDRLVFTLESSEPLIWDVAAQYEIFRALLRPDLSSDLRKFESEIVSADSTARNLSAALFKVKKRRDEQRVKEKGAGGVRAHLAAATAELEIARQSEEKLQRELENAAQSRADARIEMKRTEHAVDRATQSYEAIKYRLLKKAFADVPPSDQYVFLKLLAERRCIACGTPADDAAKELERRRDNGLCVVCGAKPNAEPKTAKKNESQQSHAEQAFAALERARSARTAAELRSQQAQQRLTGVEIDLEKARAAAEDVEATIRKLRRKLPPSDRGEVTREEENIQAIRRQVTRFRRERDEAEDGITRLLEKLRSSAEAIRSKVEKSFQERAQPFFADQVRLVYAPRTDRIGQGGRAFEFPAFEIEMSPDGPHGDFVRRDATQVSLSQREYLDTIFRMALLDTLGSDGASLVLDGPEGAVDAVFAERAGDLFSTYAAESNQNVLLACNVIEGGLIPNTLREFKTKKERMNRIVNLLDSAFPTTALRKLKSEYEEKVDEILKQPGR